MLLVLEVHPEVSRLHPGHLDHAGDAWRAADVVRDTAEMIRGRLAASGIGEGAVVQQREGGRLTVELPGVRYGARILTLTTTTGLFEARLSAYPLEGGEGVSRQEILEHYQGQPPSDVEILEGIPPRNPQGVAPAASLFFAVERHRVITNRDFATVRSEMGYQNTPIVAFRLEPEAARIFSDFTSTHINRGLALVLDGKVVSAPVIRSRIPDSGIIEGSFSQAEVEDLVTILRHGPLPAEVTCVETHTRGL